MDGVGAGPTQAYPPRFAGLAFPHRSPSRWEKLGQGMLALLAVWLPFSCGARGGFGEEDAQRWPKCFSSQKPLTWPLPFIHFSGGILCSFSPVQTITFYLFKKTELCWVCWGQSWGWAQPASVHQSTGHKLTQIRNS